MIQNLIFGIFLKKKFIWTYNFCAYVPVDIVRVFYNFRFSSRKSQSQQNLAKVSHFTIRFHSKHLTYFLNPKSLDIDNKMLPKHNQKPFSLYKFSSKRVSVCVRKKKFALDHFFTPKSCILQAL